MYYVYVIQPVDRSNYFYIGYSSDLKKRIESHNTGQNKSTKHTQWRLVYYEAYITAQSARQRDQRLKKNKRMRSLLLDRIKSSLEPFSGEGSS